MNGPIRGTPLTITRTYRKDGQTYCDLECDCYGTGELQYEDGRVAIGKNVKEAVLATNLKSGATTSCGCAKNDYDEPDSLLPNSQGMRLKRFGHLFVMGWDRKARRYVCSCNCGLPHCPRFASVTMLSLVKNRRIGCDLFQKRQAQLRRNHPRESQSYADMLRRTSNENDKRYGKRGVRISRLWLPYDPGCGLERFLKDMEACPEGHTLHRDETKGIHYSPDSCVWADARTQSERRHGVTMVRYLEQEMSVSAFCRVIKKIAPNVSKRTVKFRLDWGLSPNFIARTVDAQLRGVSITREIVDQLLGDYKGKIPLHSVHPWSTLAAKLGVTGWDGRNLVWDGERPGSTMTNAA
jgi:hypothetical protein